MADHAPIFHRETMSALVDAGLEPTESSDSILLPFTLHAHRVTVSGRAVSYCQHTEQLPCGGSRSTMALRRFDGRGWARRLAEFCVELRALAGQDVEVSGG